MTPRYGTTNIKGARLAVSSRPSIHLPTPMTSPLETVVDDILIRIIGILPLDDVLSVRQVKNAGVTPFMSDAHLLGFPDIKAAWSRHPPSHGMALPVLFPSPFRGSSYSRDPHPCSRDIRFGSRMAHSTCSPRTEHLDTPGWPSTASFKPKYSRCTTGCLANRRA